MSSQTTMREERELRYRPSDPSTLVKNAAVLALLALVALALAGLPLRWAAAGLCAAGLGLLILVRPAMGLAAVALAIPFGDLVRIPGMGANGVDVLVALTAAGWLVHGLAERRVVFRRPPLAWPLLIFVWCAALSLTQANSWREGLPEWIKWAEFAILYLVATQILDRASSAWLLAAMFTAGLAEFVLGAYQFLNQVGPEAFVLQGRFMRAYGTFRQPNPYAGYLGYIFPVAASLVLGALERWGRDRRRADLTLLGVSAAVATGAALGIIMSWSRGAWMGLIAGGLTVVAVRGRRSAVMIAGAALFLALVIFSGGIHWMPTQIAERIGDLGNYVSLPDPARTEITDANFAVLERLAHWRAGQRMFDDHPILGVGIGNYGVAYGSYALPHWYEPLGHAHNVYVNFLAETGIIGFTAFAIFWFGVAWLTWRSAVNSTGYVKALGIGVLGVWAYLSVHNLFDNLFVQHMQLQLALLVGVLVAVRERQAPAS